MRLVHPIISLLLLSGFGCAVPAVEEPDGSFGAQSMPWSVIENGERTSLSMRAGDVREWRYDALEGERLSVTAFANVVRTASDDAVVTTEIFDAAGVRLASGRDVASPGCCGGGWSSSASPIRTGILREGPYRVRVTLVRGAPPSVSVRAFGEGGRLVFPAVTVPAQRFLPAPGRILLERTDGTVVTWQSGKRPAAELLPVSDRATVRGETRSCLVGDTGRPECWGCVDWTPGIPFEQRVTLPLDATRGLLLGGNCGWSSSVRQFACGIDAGGLARCFGAAFRDPTDRLDPDRPRLVATTVESLHAGGNQICARRSDQSVVCGEVGRPLATIAGVQAVDVAIGGRHACALDPSGGVRCWGNAYGQYSSVPVARWSASSPVVFAGTKRPLAGITKIVAGWSHVCALADDGAVFCWGGAERGQLGARTGTASTDALRVYALPRALDIAAGPDGTCAIVEGGAVACWGTGVLPPGTPALSIWVPRAVSGL
jgi:hypothetical protein